MRQARPARIGGTVKLQFAVAAGIFCLLAAILLVRLMPFEADAERAEVELTIRNIRVGIHMAGGERIMHREEYRIA